MQSQRCVLRRDVRQVRWEWKQKSFPHREEESPEKEVTLSKQAKILLKPIQAISWNAVQTSDTEHWVLPLPFPGCETWRGLFLLVWAALLGDAYNMYHDRPWLSEAQTSFAHIPLSNNPSMGENAWDTAVSPKTYGGWVWGKVKALRRHLFI